MLIVCILVLIPIMSYGLAGMIARGDRALWSVIFPFLGTYIGILATLWGIRYQISKSEDAKEKENKNNRDSKIKNLKIYINFVVEKNTEIYFSEEKNNRQKFYENILDIIKTKDLNLLELTRGVVYSFDKEYISRNLEEILVLPYGKEVIELDSEFDSLEWIIKNLLLESINESKFIENRKIFEDENPQRIFSIVSLVDNMFFNENYSKYCFDRLKKNYFSNIDEEKWINILKRKGMINKYDSYLNFLVLVLNEFDITLEADLPKLAMNLKKRYLILSSLKRKEESISKLIKVINENKH